MVEESCKYEEKEDERDRPCEEVVAASRLREAYAAVDRESFGALGVQALSPRIPCASSLLETFPSLRELFTVTLNLEVLLRRREGDALRTIREKHLKWYKRIFHTLHGVHDIHALLRYWVKGMVLYEFCEINRHMEKEDDEEEEEINNDTGRQNCERGGVMRAADYAMELREALRRFPKLVAFLFLSKSQEYWAQTLSEVIREDVGSSLSDRLKLNVLQRLLMKVLQCQRQRRYGVLRCEHFATVHPHCHNNGNPLHVVEEVRQKLTVGNPSVDISELIQLFSHPARDAEERLVITVLQSVVHGCRGFFQREALLSLLEPGISEESRHVFLLKIWPQYWNNELEVMRELPAVEEACVKGILVKLVFFWETGNDVSVQETSNAPCGLRPYYIFHLMRATLQPLLDALFALDAAAEESETRSTLELLLDIANSMACIEAPPRRTLRLWDQVGAGAALPSSIPREVGYVVMADVCRAFLEVRLPTAVDHFLSGGEIPEEQRWPRLIAYLIRTEHVFHRLCEMRLLKAKLLDNCSAVPCFYGIAKNAIANQLQRKRSADLFVETLLGIMQAYLLHGSHEEAEVRRVGGGGRAKTVVVSLHNEDEVMSAVRLAFSVSSIDRFLRLYKELLAYRLLFYAVGRARDGSVDAMEARREKLQTEKLVCEYLHELLPLERNAIQQMIQMCMDMETGKNAPEGYDPQALQPEQCGHGAETVTVRPTLRLLSRLAWPSYPLLTDVPQPLHNAMDQFARFYHAQYSNRRVVWLRTSMETITFTVAYPQAGKVIVGSLELFNIFQFLSEAGTSGTTWTLLAQRIGKDKTLLQRGLKKLIHDGFFKIQMGSGEESVALNAAFKSHKPRYNFLQPPPRVGALLEENGIINEEVHRSRIASIQAVIIKHMKSVRTCLYDELFCWTRQQNPQFQLQNSDFKLALEMLIEKEFVQRDPSQKQRFVYKA
ncbi:cullin-4B [Trypanosoma cruzi]|nr:cullin-4B [Trypanosoma cruzi]